MCKYTLLLPQNRRKPSVKEDVCFIHKPEVNKDGWLDNIPHDNTELCLFHSEDLSWKTQHHIRQELIELILQLENQDHISTIDLAGIVVGEDSEEPFILKDLSFRKEVNLSNARFVNKFVVSHTVFHRGFDFRNAVFEEILSINNCSGGSTDFRSSIFEKEVYIRECYFKGAYNLFEEARFRHALRMYHTTFLGMVGFGDAHFSCVDYASEVSFNHMIFQGTLDFEHTEFDCATFFHDVTFKEKVIFKGTRFRMVRFFSNFAFTPHSFTNILIEDKAQVSFIGASPKEKVFEEKVELLFKDNLLRGKLIFAQANFNYLTKESLDDILKQAKLGKVEIGPGCIKYRHQTETQTLDVSKGNQNVIMEIARTFANYFTMQNGINLGIEILEQNAKQISFFYYSDEDITFEEFESKLRMAETDLWSLLFLRSDTRQNSESVAVQNLNQEKMISAIDGILSLQNIFYKIGVRIDTQDWQPIDTLHLLKSMGLSGDIPIDHHRLHQLIETHYSTTQIRNLFSAFAQRNLLNPSSSVTQIEESYEKIPEFPDLQTEIEYLFEKGRTLEVLERLKEVFDQTDRKAYSDVLIHLNSYHTALRDFKMQLIPYEQWNIQQARVRYAIKELISKIA